MVVTANGESTLTLDVESIEGPHRSLDRRLYPHIQRADAVEVLETTQPPPSSTAAIGTWARWPTPVTRFDGSLDHPGGEATPPKTITLNLSNNTSTGSWALSTA